MLTLILAYQIDTIENRDLKEDFKNDALTKIKQYVLEKKNKEIEIVFYLELWVLSKITYLIQPKKRHQTIAIIHEDT